MSFFSDIWNFSEFWNYVNSYNDFERIMYRSTFVLKLPVASRWKVLRRQVFTEEPHNVDWELKKFLDKAGHYIGSMPYALESEGEVGIEDNEQVPYDATAVSLQREDDFYDSGGT